MQRYRYLGQWNRIARPEINPLIYGQLIFNKVDKSSNGESIVSSVNGVGKTGHDT